ncbi:MAG TPA: RidA family protein [Cyclobacteriaceae bacterium]
MSERVSVSSGAEWEEVVGYSRAVRIGNIIEVSGTVAIERDEVIGRDDPYDQTKCILKKIHKAITEVGGKLSDVIRTRIYVTDINMWNEVGRAHGEYFHDIKPATSMIAVKSLVSPEFLVEIEATAVVS